MLWNANCLPKKCFSRAIDVLIAGSIMLILFSDRLPLRINLSASMPRGIYLLSGDSGINVGDFVMVCLDHPLAQFALQRRYLHRGNCADGSQPLLKQVVAMGSDEVVLLTNTIMIHHKTLPHSSTFRVDSINRPLPEISRGLYILKANQLWLYGTDSAKSWDSRYFGAVDRSEVMSVVKPLFVGLKRRVL
jgi:conjugative transfer signal peptidase TraF